MRNRVVKRGETQSTPKCRTEMDRYTGLTWGHSSRPCTLVMLWMEDFNYTPTLLYYVLVLHVMFPEEFTKKVKERPRWMKRRKDRSQSSRKTSLAPVSLFP